MLAWPDTPSTPAPARASVLRHRIRAANLPPARVALIRELYALAEFLAQYPDVPVDRIEARASACHLKDDVDGAAYIQILAAELDAQVLRIQHTVTNKLLSEHIDYHAFYIPVGLRHWELGQADGGEAR